MLDVVVHELVVEAPERPVDVVDEPLTRGAAGRSARALENRRDEPIRRVDRRRRRFTAQHGVELPTPWAACQVLLGDAPVVRREGPVDERRQPCLEAGAGHRVVTH